MARRSTAARVNEPASSPRPLAVAPPPAPDPSTTLRAPDGARAELTGDAVELFDPQGRLLIRYRDGALEVSPVEGDLVLASATGRVRIAAATDVVVEAARDLRLGARRGLEASAGVPGEPAEGGAIRGSRISLDPRRAVVSAPTLDVRAQTTRVATGDVTVLARQVRTTATRIATTVEDLEITAGRVVERAREAVQEVTDVFTSRLGRVRSVVQGTWSVRAKRTELKSKEDTAIDGRRVLLG